MYTQVLTLNCFSKLKCPAFCNKPWSEPKYQFETFQGGKKSMGLFVLLWMKLTCLICNCPCSSLFQLLHDSQRFFLSHFYSIRKTLTLSFSFLLRSRKFWSILRATGLTPTKTFQPDRRWSENEPYCDRKIATNCFISFQISIKWFRVIWLLVLHYRDHLSQSLVM